MSITPHDAELQRIGRIGLLSRNYCSFHTTHSKQALLRLEKEGTLRKTATTLAGDCEENQHFSPLQKLHLMEKGSRKRNLHLPAPCLPSSYTCATGAIPQGITAERELGPETNFSSRVQQVFSARTSEFQRRSARLWWTWLMQSSSFYRFTGFFPGQFQVSFRSAASPKRYLFSRKNGETMDKLSIAVFSRLFPMFARVLPAFFPGSLGTVGYKDGRLNSTSSAIPTPGGMNLIHFGGETISGEMRRHKGKKHSPEREG